MPDEKLLELLNKFANIAPGSDAKALDYIFTAAEIDDLYSEYIDAKAASDEKLMKKIEEKIAFKVDKFN